MTYYGCTRKMGPQCGYFEGPLRCSQTYSVTRFRGSLTETFGRSGCGGLGWRGRCLYRTASRTVYSILIPILQYEALLIGVGLQDQRKLQLLGFLGHFEMEQEISKSTQDTNHYFGPGTSWTQRLQRPARASFSYKFALERAQRDQWPLN